MRRSLPAAIGILALLIALVTLVPAEVWAQPATDQQFRGFDPKLVYANGQGGTASVTATSITLAAVPRSTPAVTLITTPMQRVSLALDATVEQDAGAAEPLTIGAWSALDGAGYLVVFGPSPSHDITVEGVVGGSPGTTLSLGNVVRQTVLGTYEPGTPYRVSLLLDRQNGVIGYQVFQGAQLVGQDEVGRPTFPELYAPVRLDVSAWSSGGEGSGRAVLSGYQLTLLHERFWTSKVDDPKAFVTLLVLAAASLLAIVLTAVDRRATLAVATRQTKAAVLDMVHSQPGAGAVLVLGAIALYGAGNALLFRFAGHPFDMGGARVFAYVAWAYGPFQLYYLPNVVPLAQVWKGTPFLEAGYPYGPVHDYLFAAAGGIHQAMFGARGSALQLEAVLKSTNVLFGLADAGLIYAIVGQTGLAPRWAWIAAASWLFNPAVWFSMSVWGQTHVISVFFVLAAVCFAQRGNATLAWLGLVAACLSRPQMLVFALLIGIVLLRKFDWRSNVAALSWAIVIGFLFLLPLTLFSSPSLPVDVVLNNFRIQEAGGNDPSVTTVSQGAYSIWPLVLLARGASGLGRIYAPSLVPLVGPLSYQRASQILTATALLAVAAAVLRIKRRSLDQGGYLPLATVGIMSFLMLLTGIVSTHFLLALPFLLLCRRWMNPAAYFTVAAIWTITTLVPMFGDMGTVLTQQNQLMAPTFKPITEFVVHLYGWDRFINAGVVANICAVVWLAVVALRIQRMTVQLPVASTVGSQPPVKQT